MNAHLKSVASIILLGALQVALLVVLHDGLLHIARAFGRDLRPDIQYGITIHFSTWIFVVSAFAIPSSLILARSRGLAAILLLAFLLVWSWLFLPSLSYHPLRGSLLFVLGVVLIGAFAWFATLYVCFTNTTNVTTKA